MSKSYFLNYIPRNMNLHKHPLSTGGKIYAEKYIWQAETILSEEILYVSSTYDTSYKLCSNLF